MTQLSTPLAGVDLTAVVAGTGASNDEGNEFPLGTIVVTEDGKEFMYVHSAEAGVANDVYIIDEAFEAVLADTTSSASARGDRVGVATGTIADNDFFWIQISGPVTVNVATGAAANTELNTTATAGRLDDDASVGAEVIDGLFTTAAEASNAAAAILNRPIVGRTL